MIRIDEEFKNLLPPLTDDEYSRLEKKIEKEGMIFPIITWNGTIIDGHNRFKICNDLGISFKTEEMPFDSRDDAIKWILDNQLGKRNLNDYQKATIADRYREIISKKSKENSLSNLKQNKKTDSQKSVHRECEKNRTRDELAKTAGVSTYAIEQARTINENGTEEQKERAEHGERMNAIVREIKKDHPKTESQKKPLQRKQPICKADSQLLQQKHFIRKTSRQNINQKSEMHL